MTFFAKASLTFLSKEQSFFPATKIMRKVKSVYMSVLAILLAVSIVANGISGQSQREILNNAKIIELVRLGLSEALIVEKIRQSDCKCDTSTTELARLKSAKVSDAIIIAMMESSRAYSDSASVTAQNEQNKPVRTVETDNSADPKELRELSEPGIYLFENGKMQGIEASVFSGAKMNALWGTLTYGIKKTKWKAKVRGKNANMQTTSSQPVFYFVFNPELKNSGATMAGLWGLATSPNEFLMVQMGIKDASREAVLGEYGAWTGAEMGARDKDIREYSFEKIKPGIYKVVPKTALKPGEYCFYYAGNITGIGFAGGKVFDFGVKSEPTSTK